MIIATIADLHVDNVFYEQVFSFLKKSSKTWGGKTADMFVITYKDSSFKQPGTSIKFMKIYY